jgi:hypothetical protein
MYKYFGVLYTSIARCKFYLFVALCPPEGNRLTKGRNSPEKSLVQLVYPHLSKHLAGMLGSYLGAPCIM